MRRAPTSCNKSTQSSLPWRRISSRTWNLNWSRAGRRRQRSKKENRWRSLWKEIRPRRQRLSRSGTKIWDIQQIRLWALAQTSCYAPTVISLLTSLACAPSVQRSPASNASNKMRSSATYAATLTIGGQTECKPMANKDPSFRLIARCNRFTIVSSSSVRCQTARKLSS